MATHQCVHVLEAHTDKVRCLHWDSARQVLYSAGHDNQLLGWSADDWSVVTRYEAHKDWVTSVQLSQDGQFLISTSVDKTCRVWEPDTGQLVHTLSHENWVTSACMFNGLLVTGVGDATIIGWNIETAQKCWSVDAHKEHNAVSSVIQAGDDLLLTGSWDGSVKEWSLESLEQAAL